MEELGKTIGNNLTFLRKKAGLTQMEFGENFSYSDKTVSKWEKGEVIPNVETLKLISDYYGVSVDFILTEHNNEEDFRSIIKKTPRAANKIILIMLVVTIIFAIAMTIYVASIYNMKTSDPYINKFWTVFLWSVPFSFLVIAMLTKRMFYSRKMVVIYISCFVWTILLAAFITFLYERPHWYLFFIGIPVQAALILFAYLKQ
jgi:transcriptional regulator with XRE-family HTH domain